MQNSYSHAEAGERLLNCANISDGQCVMCFYLSVAPHCRCHTSKTVVLSAIEKFEPAIGKISFVFPELESLRKCEEVSVSLIIDLGFADMTHQVVLAIK